MRDSFDTFSKGMMAFCVVMILLCFYGCTMSIKQANEDRAACEARGGVYHSIYKSQDLCLRQEDVIPLGEDYVPEEDPEEEREVIKYKPRFTANPTGH